MEWNYAVNNITEILRTASQVHKLLTVNTSHIFNSCQRPTSAGTSMDPKK